MGKIESKIESTLSQRISEIWPESLAGVISVAESNREPESVICERCEGIYYNPKIEEFLIGGTIYTPPELSGAFEEGKEVAEYLKRATLDRLCNLSAELGRAMRNERPLYTQDRRAWWRDPRFTKEYHGNVQEALLGFFQYLLAEREDLLVLEDTADWEHCADKGYVEWASKNKKLHEEYFKKYPQRGYLQRHRKNLLSDIESHKKLLQSFLDDNAQVVERTLRGNTCYTGVLIYLGIEPAVSCLIESFTHKVKPSS